MFGFFQRRRRARISAEPFPAEWVAILEEHVPFYRTLDPALLDRFHAFVRIFESEKYFIGARGFDVELHHRVAISAVAIRLVLNLDLRPYDRLTEIIIYPFAYTHGGDEVPGEQTVILGEAHSFGTVVLSWPAVISGLENPCDGHDTALHEFAHVLDRDSGSFNGTPRLRATEDYNAWGEVLTDHFERLQDGLMPERAVLRSYGATNEAEFFSVATESFFERPGRMKRLTPDLYEALSKFYGFDPSANPLCPGDH
jgi:Mlc titration factor MtfA (ptsG expression regulator)